MLILLPANSSAESLPFVSSHPFGWEGKKSMVKLSDDDISHSHVDPHKVVFPGSNGFPWLGNHVLHT